MGMEAEIFTLEQPRVQWAKQYEHLLDWQYYENKLLSQTRDTKQLLGITMGPFII